MHAAEADHVIRGNIAKNFCFRITNWLLSGGKSRMFSALNQTKQRQSDRDRRQMQAAQRRALQRKHQRELEKEGPGSMVEEEEVDQKQQQQQATTAGAAAASVDPAAQIENQPEFADLCKVDKKPKKEKKHKSDKRNKKQAVIE